MEKDIPPRRTFPPSQPPISKSSWDDFRVDYADDQEEQRDMMETILQYQRSQNEWFVQQHPTTYIPPSAAFHQLMIDKVLARHERRLDRSNRRRGDDGSSPSGS